MVATPEKLNPSHVGVERINFLSPLFLLGIVFYFLNRFSDAATGIPAAELAVIGLIVWSLFQQRASHFKANHVGIFCGVVFIGLVMFTSVLNHLGSAEIMRNIIKNTMLILPILLYPLVNDKRIILTLMVGIIAGFGLHFMVESLIDAAQGGFTRALRWIQPTPVIFLMLLFCLDKQILSRTVRRFFWVALASTFFVSIAIQSRGALVSVGIALMFYVIGKLSGRSGNLVGLAVILLLSLNLIIGQFFGPALDLVYELGYVTVSNTERAFLIDFSVKQIIPENFWTGVGISNFSRLYYLSGFPSSLDWGGSGLVESPHNTFLNIAVFYGIPTLVMFAIMLFVFSKDAVRHSYLEPALTAFCLSLLARHGMFFDYSGVYRLEILMMWVLIFYRLNPTAVLPFRNGKRVADAAAK